MAAETTITMPQLGESLTEGTITKWLKSVGDFVKEDEPLFEVATDKINTEVGSSGTGTITKLLAKEGDTVKIGEALAILSSNGASATVSAPVPAAESPAVNATASAPTNGSNGTAQQSKETGLYPSDPSNLITLPPPTVPAKTGGDGNDNARWREKSSPLVRRILTENSLDLSVLDSIKGTGAEGRVTKDDVIAYIASAKTAPAKAAPAPLSATPVAQPFTLPAGIPSWITPPMDADSEVTPLAGIRKMIAERLSYSEHIAPHVTTFAEVDVTDLVAFRAKHKQWIADEYKANLTFLPFIIRAIATGLKAFPGMNASLIGDQLYTHKRFHLGLAVSLDQAGLMIPVIKDADHKSIIDLAIAISDLAARARTNQLKPDEIRGSTFTLSNPGAFGGWISTPVINQPNAAILNTGKIMKMPWVMPDDSIAARSIMYLSLSYDHRIVDGETSVKFLQHMKKTLENVEKSFLL